MVENNNQTRYHYTMTNKFDWKVIFENYDADLFAKGLELLKYELM